MSVDFHRIAKQFKELQSHIIDVLNKADGGTKFQCYPWEKDIGLGVTSIMQQGSVIEKAGVNFSKVSGPFTSGLEHALQTKAGTYSATGVSSIIHPNTPHVPIIHMNVRYFELNNGTSWFGGGIDLTPHYIIPKDSQYFHSRLKTVCDTYSPEFYSRFKNWADDYFYLPHRNETRGVGGIFFDRITPNAYSLIIDDMVNFCIGLGKLYPEIYAFFIDKYRNHTFTETEKLWQNVRRSRYVEFNLLYDRGTKFGLESGGNTESILVSMPPEASWFYNFTVENESPEAKTQELLKKGIDWINMNP